MSAAEQPERSRGLFEHMREGLALCQMCTDPQGQPDSIFLEVNPAFEKLTGLKDAAGKRASELIPWLHESDPDLFEICLRVVATGTSERFERYVQPMGQWFAVSVYSPAPGLFATLFDVITERKAADERIAGERERLAVTLQSIGDAVIATDEQARITLLNGVAEELTGWTQAEALGRPLDEIFRIIHEETGLPAVSPVAQVLRDGKVVALANHISLIARDGSARPIADSSAPIRDARGQITGVVLVFRDQSSERSSRAAQHKSEAMLRAFSEAIPDPIYVKDREGRYIFANPAALKHMGRPEAEVLASTAREIWKSDPAQVERVMAVDERILRSGVSESLEEAMPTVAGERIFLTSKVPFRDRDGNVIGIFGGSRDITERKRMEESLREREYLLAESQRIAHVGTWSWELEKDAMRWSAETYRICGRAEETFALTPASFLEVIHEEDRPRVHDCMQGCSLGKPPGDLEFRVVRPDGSERRVQLRGERQEFGLARTRLTGTMQDVTERHRADERLRALIENSSDMIAVLDAGMRLAFWSNSAAEQLGWTAEELVGRDNSQLIHPEDREATREIFAALCAEPDSTVRFTRRQLHKDRSYRLIEVTAQSRLHDPAVNGVVVNLRDITNQRHLEDQLRQAQKLEAIGRLTGGIAHDFNNVLTVILSHAAFLLGDLLAPDPRRHDAEDIRVAAERAAALTRQLLAFSRKQLLEPRVLDLNLILTGLEKMLRRLIGEDVVLVLEAATPLGSIKADAGQLEQVIMNLAINSRDAMPGGGRFTLQTSEVDLLPADLLSHPGSAPGRYVLLSVRDTGTGMSAEVQQHLFEPFFTTKEQGKGTGLGLSTVLGIVQQSGGHIQVKSTEGHGTEFRIYLPRVEGGPQAAQARSAERLSLGDETILLVDDDDLVRATAARILTSRGYRVLVNASGPEAMAAAEQHAGRIDLVVSDIVMPGESGPLLVQRLQARWPRLPVLFMSGFTEHAVVERTFAAGADYLQKPFTPDTLAQRVRAILDRARRLPGAAVVAG